MIIIANWKAYVETLDKAKTLVASAKRLSAAHAKIEIVLAPAAPQLALLASNNRSKVAFAAQDISAGLGGAATGEITAQTAADSGATYVIIGHSERRAMGETDEQIVEKLQHALAHNLTPILCVGEAERDAASQYLSVVRGQIERALVLIAEKDRRRVIIAYEPLWAIGKTAEDAIHPHDLAEMVLYIRKVFAELLPGKGGKTTVLYGGSVEPEDVRDLAGGTSVDGFLIGHASVAPATFSAIIKALS